MLIKLDETMKQSLVNSFTTIYSMIIIKAGKTVINFV